MWNAVWGLSTCIFHHCFVNRETSHFKITLLNATECFLQLFLWSETSLSQGRLCLWRWLEPSWVSSGLLCFSPFNSLEFSLMKKCCPLRLISKRGFQVMDLRKRNLFSQQLSESIPQLPAAGPLLSVPKGSLSICRGLRRVSMGWL